MDPQSNKDNSKHSKINFSGLSLAEIIEKLATQLLEEKKNSHKILIEYKDLAITHTKTLKENEELAEKIKALLREDIDRLSQELLLKEINSLLNNKDND